MGLATPQQVREKNPMIVDAEMSDWSLEMGVEGFQKSCGG